tara:strand:+ start:35782 stop:36435 length:654 start_codon:yes stop_codon:yes gene_type:complete
MGYVTREMALSALTKMKNFHQEAVSLYERHNMDLLDNLGRRNIVMSQAQEAFFAQALKEHYPDAHEDGRTGQPDIVIPSIDKELECKLTSRHKGGAISFQSDYQTLHQKGSLDYLYIIADIDFMKFAVLHFKDLTTEDFREVSNGSRGKVAMAKHRGMQKCSVLVGEAININDINLNKLRIKLQHAKTEKQKQKLRERIQYWVHSPTKYSFELESIS